MASSTLSLDSLSSPSPSPSPPPPQQQQQQNRQLKQASTTAPLPTSTPATASASHKYKASYRSIDEDSELSELTEAEDDQDPSIPQDKRAISDSTTPGGSSSAVAGSSSMPVKPTSSSSSMKKPTSNAGSSSKESEEQGMTSSSSKTGGGRRGTHQRSASSRRGGPGRRQKRSSIVPAPMWGWADPKPAVAAPAEEEEEEMPLQPKIMEEEEEEEEAEEEEEEEGDDYDPEERKERSPGVEEEEEEEDRARSANYYPRNPYGQRVVTTNKTRGTAKRGGRRQAASSSRKHDDDAASGDNEPTKTWTRSKPPSSSTTSIRKARQKDIDNDDKEDLKDAPALNGADKEESASGGSAYPSPNLARKKTHAKRKPGRSAASPKSVSDTEQVPTASAGRKKKLNGASSKPPRTNASSAGRNNNVESESDAHANDDPPSSDDEKTDSEPDPTPKKSIPNHIPPSPTKSLAKPISSANAAKPNSKVASSAMSSNNAAASALSALAAAADALDPTDPGSKAVATINAAAASMSIMAGSTSLVEPVSKSVSQADDVAGNGASSAAADNTPSGSRSPSPGAATDDESEQSADEPVKAARGGRGRRGKPAGRGSRGRGRGAGASRTSGRKGPPPALRIDTSVEDSNKPVAVSGEDAMDVDDQDETSAHPDTAVNDRDSDDGQNNEPDDPEPEEEEEEDSGDERSVQGANDQEEEQAEEEQVDGDDEANERERDVEDAEQAVDNDVEREPDNDVEDRDLEHEHEVDNDEEAANDADMDADDHESDLQPAHRAEALDVLANIELKFALLRERVYVEKMEELGWEERLVKEAAHPEMIHLQKELSKRKDKRLELASRKRSYEVAHATKRRKRDEDAIWSWWKFTTEELQTEMIAETSRKRRKIERERRAMERPQPVRRIPAPIPQMIPPPPSIRKIIKSYPFGSRKHNKSDLTNIYPQLNNHFPRHYVYPEITTLSASEISSDLDYLLANRRQPYDAYPPLQMPQSYSQGLQRITGPSLGRGSMGLGLPNGQTPAPQPGMMGPPGTIPPGISYDQYGDVQMSSQPTFGPGGPPPGRMRESTHPPQPGPGGPPPPRENPYPTFPSSSGNRAHQHSQGPSMPAPGGSSHGFPPGHGYPGDHEAGAAGPGVSSSGGGHQLHPHHPYFSQGSMMGPGGSYPSSSSQMASSSNPSHSGPAMKNTYNRRSMSPPHMQPNGSSGPSKHWSGSGMGGYPPANGKSVEWDPRIAHEEGERERERERERVMREREREFRKREEREKGDRDVPDRERAARYREREYEERERERQREMQLQQSSQHGGPPPPGPPHSHPPGSRDAPPSSQGGSSSMYHSGSHHHHRPSHHHHIVHRHYGQGGPQHPHNSPIPGPAVTQSPRAGRDYDRPPSSMHSAPPNEPGNPSASKSGAPREREPAWQGKGPEEPPHPSGIEYEPGNRDREVRKPHSRRPSPGPPMVPLDRDRPLATPFVMASTQTMQQLNGASSSPRNGPSWNGPGSSSEDTYRGHATPSAPSQSYGASPHDAHMRSPVQRYTPANRAPSSGSSQAPFHRMGSPPPPVSRARPPLSPPYPSHQARSPLTSPKMRPMSPPLNPKSQLSATGPAYSSPHLSGPGRITTPTGHPSMSGSGGAGPTEPMAKNGIGAPAYGSRTASPLMSSLHPPILGRPSLNGGGNGSSASDRDRLERADRERHVVTPSPRLGASASVTLPPTSKLSATPMVDGH